MLKPVLLICLPNWAVYFEGILGVVAVGCAMVLILSDIRRFRKGKS